MSKIFLLPFFGSLFLMLVLNSCSKENDPVPVSTATSSSPNAKFLGDWYVSEHTTQSGNSTYNMKVVDSTNNTYILFVGLYNFNSNIKATTSGNNIVIPSQIIEGTKVSGSGTLVNTSRMTLAYYVNDGLSIDTVSAVLTK